MTLAALQPTRKDLVFDLVQHAGFDVTDWISSSNDSRGPKANPKYCYEWSFIQPGVAVILNLWHDAMTDEGGLVVQRNNFRQDGPIEVSRCGGGVLPKWIRRCKPRFETTYPSG
jgi:5-methylcytosine-specific restriction enzyme A